MRGVMWWFRQEPWGRHACLVGVVWCGACTTPAPDMAPRSPLEEEHHVQPASVLRRATQEPTRSSTIQWSMPTLRSTARVSRGFSSTHQGIDIPLPMSTPLHAPLGGVITEAGPAAPFVCPLDGRLTDDQLVVRWRASHPGGRQVEVALAHLDRVDVAVGQRIAPGEVVGQSGRSGCARGPHVHMAMWVADTPHDRLEAVDVLSDDRFEQIPETKRTAPDVGYRP